VVFSSLGEVSWNAGAASVDSVFAVAPDGRMALSGGGWFQMIDPDGGLLESEQLPAIEQLLGMRFVDDDRLALVGSLGSALDPTAARDAAFGMHDLGGLGWFSTYSDSRVSCDGQPTGISDEMFVDVVVMPDGGFVLTGVENRIGAGWPPLPSTHALVAVLDDADAQVMRVDRAAWPGVAREPIVAGDGSVMVLINHSTSPDSYQIRKYLP
jgi:hypothetical protein